MTRREYLKDRYDTLKAMGRCVTCKGPSDGGTRCRECRRRHTWQQQYYRGIQPVRYVSEDVKAVMENDRDRTTRSYEAAAFRGLRRRNEAQNSSF